MSDGDVKSEDVAGDEESPDPCGGERLAKARRELEIPIVEIAKELHLDEYKVRAMECNDFDVIGAPVFAKGHLRKYAHLVEVDEADIMADYYQLTRSAGATPVVSVRSRPRQALALGPWIAAILIVLAIAAVYWWFAARPAQPAPRVTGEISALPTESRTQADEIDEVPATVEDSAELETVEVSEAEPVTQPTASSDPSDMQLSITYSGDCWTEISDANGRSLFFALGTAGRTVDLSGEAPFNVLFGDAANVSVTVNNVAFDISSADRRGRTARMTITGP
jgi:cytoskeleton protein RodZ